VVECHRDKHTASPAFLRICFAISQVLRYLTQCTGFPGFLCNPLLLLDCSAGLADGVGSWIEAGVDAGIFARELMGNCKSAAKRIPPSKTAPMNILKNGYFDTKKTVCLPCNMISTDVACHVHPLHSCNGCTESAQARRSNSLEPPSFCGDITVPALLYSVLLFGGGVKPALKGGTLLNLPSAYRSLLQL